MPYSPAKAAEIAGVSRSLISKEVKAGNLVATRNNRKHLSIEAKDLDDWMSRRTVRADPGPEAVDSVPLTQGDTSRIQTLEVEVREVRAQLKQALDDKNAWKSQAELLASRLDAGSVVVRGRGIFSRLFGR